MDWHAMLAAWGRVLTGYAPALSIEITRECPLQCPGCYAYGDDHLGGDADAAPGPRLQGPGAGRRRPRARRSPSAASSVDRRRRAARPLPRAEHAAPAAVEARDSRAARHERRARDAARVARHSALEDRRLHRRPPAGARRAADAGHLRSHPQAHRRPPDRRCTARSRASR